MEVLSKITAIVRCMDIINLLNGTLYRVFELTAFKFVTECMDYVMRKT